MSISKTRIAFFGTPDFSVPSLRALHEAGYDIVGVITSPDKPVGRKKVMTPSPVKKCAIELNLTPIESQSLKTAEFVELFKKLNADLSVVVAFGKIIPADVLKLCKEGFLNVHPSLLPLLRGPSPIQTSIMQGVTESGITIMLLDDKVDHGAVLAQTPYTISPDAYEPEITCQMAESGARLLVNSIREYLGGKLTPKPQDDSSATYCSMISISDGQIDWSRKCSEIYNQVRALSREPGTWTAYHGKKLKILRAKPTSFTAKIAGKVSEEGGQVFVSCSDYMLELIEVQYDGGKAMRVSDFLRGHKDIFEATLGR